MPTIVGDIDPHFIHCSLNQSMLFDNYIILHLFFGWLNIGYSILQEMVDFIPHVHG